jgi:hypothetical protein
MTAVDQFECEGATVVVIGAGQAEYTPLPALVFEDGKTLIEWTFTEEERARIARGENLRHWIWRSPRCACGLPRYFEPLALEVTDEHHG